MAKNKLQLLRKQKNWTQANLATQSGVSVQAIQHYEQGVRDLSNASASIVLALARALDTTVEYILQGDEKC